MTTVHSILSRVKRMEHHVQPALPRLPTQAEQDAVRAKVQAIVAAYEHVYPLDEERQSLAQRYARSLGLSLMELKARLHAQACAAQGFAGGGRW